MFEFLSKLFTSDFMPHGHCFFWYPSVLWLHVISDTIIGVSYYSIPLALVCIVKKRDDLAFNWMFVLFATFIFACGTTHFLEVWTMWNGTYRIVGVFKAVCAAISALTAILLWPLITKIIAFPSCKQLENEILERKNAEQNIQRAREGLEKEVKVRTEELVKSNRDLQEERDNLTRFHNLTLDREHEMIRLKSEVNALLEQRGEASKYEVPHTES